MNRRGSILVSTLWIVLILAILAVWIGKAASMEVRFSGYAMDSIHALHLARAGMVKSMTSIVKDDLLPEKQDGVLEKGEFSCELSDEEGKFNMRIDKAAFTGISGYRYILKGLCDKLDLDTINAIIDWQDLDSEPLPGSAEGPYYENLDKPYQCKNAPFEYIEELLLVKGVTRGIFEELKPHITVHGDGRINMNTASEKVLEAVINPEGKYDGLIKKLINYRNGEDGKPGTADDDLISEDTIASAESSMGLTALEAGRLSFLAGYFVYRSKNFRITATGRYNGVARTITAIVEKPDTEGRIDEVSYYHED